MSPHLTVYRFMYTMALSILHRISGVFMALGLGVLVYWLMAAASGEAGYAAAASLLSLWIFKLLLLAWLASFLYHFLNGLRHLAWDAGWGLEKLQARRSAWAVIGAALIALVVFGYLLFGPQAGAS
jgi:succinate dehydrogenase / fumarate reductase cytochrome b subunit